jgi:hypothetical protein
MENLEQFLQRKSSEQSEKWLNEYKALEKAHKEAEEKKILDSKDSAEREIRLKRLAFEKENEYKSPAQQITCSTCGGSVLESASSHSTNNGDLCIRKPLLAKQSGRITKSTYDDLSEEERTLGYVIKGVGFCGSGADDRSTNTFSPSGKANLLAGNVIPEALRKR